jgi:hypothetical protein
MARAVARTYFLPTAESVKSADIGAGSAEAGHDLAGEQLHRAADLGLGEAPEVIQQSTWPTPSARMASMWRATVSGEPNASVSCTRSAHVIVSKRAAMAPNPGWSVGCASSSMRSGITKRRKESWYHISASRASASASASVSAT